jgi:hypothetical protein
VRCVEVVCELIERDAGRASSPRRMVRLMRPSLPDVKPPLSCLHRLTTGFDLERRARPAAAGGQLPLVPVKIT